MLLQLKSQLMTEDSYSVLFRTTAGSSKCLQNFKSKPGFTGNTRWLGQEPNTRARVHQCLGTTALAPVSTGENRGHVPAGTCARFPRIVAPTPTRNEGPYLCFATCTSCYFMSPPYREGALQFPLLTEYIARLLLWSGTLKSPKSTLMLSVQCPLYPGKALYRSSFDHTLVKDTREIHYRGIFLGVKNPLVRKKSALGTTASWLFLGS